MSVNNNDNTRCASESGVDSGPELVFNAMRDVLNKTLGRGKIIRGPRVRVENRRLRTFQRQFNLGRSISIIKESIALYI